jgi:microcystin-dependent protein
MALKLSNNGVTKLVSSLSTTATVFPVTPGSGALFPTLGAGDWCPITAIRPNGALEIMYVTAISGDTFTVQRAKEGTAALAFSANDRIEQRLTAAILQQNSDTIDALGLNKLDASSAVYVRANGGILALTYAGGKYVISKDGSAGSNLATEDFVTSSFFTGFELGYWGATAPAGWVLASGRTIGSAASGAAERANADTAALFALLWGSTTNTALPIQDAAGSASTRGASAAADFAANKRLPLPDLRGRLGIGLDNMGGTAAGRMTAAGLGFDAIAAGSSGGVQSVALTTAQMPAHNHAVTDPGHTHGHNANVSGTQGSSGTGGSAIFALYGAASISAAFTGISIQNNGSGGVHSNVQPSIARNVIIKL